MVLSDARQWLILLATILAAGAACSHSSPSTGHATAETASSTQAAFEVYPVEQIVGVKNPHVFRGKPLCQRCHYADLKLTNEPNALCRECHAFGHGNHPVDVIQKTRAPDLPLIEGGRVACHTCHDPHQNRSVLRKPFDKLCLSCHQRH